MTTLWYDNLIDFMRTLLGVVYLMDHEINSCSPKFFDWPQSSSHYHFVLQKGNNVKVIMELFMPTLSTVMVQWVMWSEWQKRFSCYKNEWTLVEKCCFNILTLNIFLFFFFLSKVLQLRGQMGRKKGRRLNMKVNPKLPFLAI